MADRLTGGGLFGAHSDGAVGAGPGQDTGAGAAGAAVVSGAEAASGDPPSYGPVAVLGLIGAITVAWWVLALWPAGGGAPPWLERARAVCFNLTDTGLPDGGGWILLVGQPLGMVGLLWVGWGEGVRRGLRRLGGRGLGRAALAVSVAVVLVGLGAAAWRVTSALARAAPPQLPLVAGTASTPVDRPAPGGMLVDQAGRPTGVASFAGRPLLVTFAFGNCATICPVVVHQALAARGLVRGEPPALMVVTLDPWRDTPARLASIHARWGLPPDARVVGGSVEEVEAWLDAWQVPRARDPRTGDVVHPALTYLIDGSGTIRYATTGRAQPLAALLEEMAASGEPGR